MNNPDHIFQSVETIFLGKILKFFDLDPGWKKIGSGINIPDPQHWMHIIFLRVKSLREIRNVLVDLLIPMVVPNQSRLTVGTLHWQDLAPTSSGAEQPLYGTHSRTCSGSFSQNIESAKRANTRYFIMLCGISCGELADCVHQPIVDSRVQDGRLRPNLTSVGYTSISFKLSPQQPIILASG